MISLGGFEFSLDVLVLGAITGMSYGILGVGLVLTFRSNRIINFAHAEMGVLPAALLALAVVQWNMPFWLMFPVALAIGGAVGAVSEVVVVRRLRDAPRLMSVVATLGLAQVLLLIAAITNSSMGSGTTFPMPPGLPEFTLGGLFATRAHSGMLLLSPIVVLALHLFLSRTRIGTAIRACVDNPQAARMDGVSPNRMSTISWALAGAVSAFSVILILPTRAFINTDVMGPSLLLRALAAAVLARMQSIPGAMAAGIGFGVIEQALLWNHPQGGLVEAAMFAVIVVALLTQKGRTGRGEARSSAWAMVRPWDPLPDHVANMWLVVHGRKLSLLIAVAVGVVLLTFSSGTTAVTLTIIFAFSLVGLSIGIATGLGGELSLGQFAVAGVGAVASVHVASATGNYALAFLSAAVAGGMASLIIGLPALRIRGLMLAVTTLGFALASESWLLQQTWTLGEGVDPGRPLIGSFVLESSRQYAFFALGVLLLGFWLAGNIWSSGHGRLLRALRDDEPAARAFSVNPVRIKLEGFVLAGLLAGLGGAVYAHGFARVSASAFPIRASINVAAMAVIGGIGVRSGPLFGAIYIIGLPLFLPLDNAALAATALGWLILIVYFPGGILQLLAPLRDRVVRRLVVGAASTPTTDDQQSPLASPRPHHGLGGPGVRPSAVGQAPTTTALEIADLSKRFGGLRAVDNVSFSVGVGETLGIIGPNGAGKTTLFDLISGFEDVDTGRILFHGADVTSLRPEARAAVGLARSFQDAPLFPTLSVVETVAVALERSSPSRMSSSLAGGSRMEARRLREAAELVELMGLSTYRNKLILELSTGTKRIVELACMLALRPTVLLLDEPSSGIAQREVEALGELLSQLRESLHVTMLVIEHDMPLVASLADRMIAMESGSIIASGTPAEVRSNPEVIKSYLGGDLVAITRSNQPATVR